MVRKGASPGVKSAEGRLSEGKDERQDPARRKGAGTAIVPPSRSAGRLHRADPHIEIRCYPSEELGAAIWPLYVRKSGHRSVSAAAQRLVALASATRMWARFNQHWGHLELTIDTASWRIDDVPGLWDAIHADLKFRPRRIAETRSILKAFAARHQYPSNVAMPHESPAKNGALGA